VRGERHPGQAQAALRGTHDRVEVIGVEVPLRHRHRLAPGSAHGQQCRRVRIGVQQGHLPTDQLRLGARTTPYPEQSHLPFHLAPSVVPVDPDLVGVRGVVAGRAGQVAPGKHTVHALAPHRRPPQELRRGADTGRQFLPPTRHRGEGLRCGEPGRHLPARQQPDESPDRSAHGHGSGHVPGTLRAARSLPTAGREGGAGLAGFRRYEPVNPLRWS